MKILRPISFICVLLTQIFLFANNAFTALIPWPEGSLPTQHLILYSNDGTNTIFTEQLTNMQEFTIPKETPTRPGYIFSGWASQPDAEIAEYQPGEHMRCNAELIELYAIWRPEQAAFILFYDANGGSNPPQTQTAPGGVLFCQFIINEQEPQRPGFDFIGWSLASNSTEAEYFPGDIFSTINKQNILYAVWQEQPKLIYTLAYSADGAENIPSRQSIESNSSGCTFQISDIIPQRPGFIFLGWSKSPDAEQPEYQPSTYLDCNRTFTMLYAVWQEQQQFTYRLFFDANGGFEAPPEQIAQSFEAYYTFTIPAQTPQRPGYAFLGWSPNPNAITADFQPQTEVSIITQKFTLYAVWQQQTTPTPEQLFTLVYHANGGTDAPQTQLAYSTNSNHTFKISTQQPQRAGHTFLGWNRVADAVYAEYQPGDDFVTSDIDNVLFAVWRPTPTVDKIEYKLIYDANGGQNAPTAQLAYGNSANCIFELTAEKPERLGYTFLGWAFTAYAEKPDCTPGQTIITNHRQLILYAVWQLNKPPKPSINYLHQILGNQAVNLICTNSAGGHANISWPLLPESFSCDIIQSADGYFTALISVKPDLYLQAYNEQLKGHKLAADSQPQNFKLIYAEEYAAWILPPDFPAPSFDVFCITPSQPTAADLLQILGTPFLVSVKCIEKAEEHHEHYPATYGLLPGGFQISPVQLNEQNIYTCQLTFNAQPYINAYQVSYGAHKLAANAAPEQSVELIYDPTTNSWHKSACPLPCFPVLYAPEPEAPPIYNYSLTFNANGGQNAPFPQKASSYDQTYLFVIPSEKPTFLDNRFLGWAEQPNASTPTYQPGSIIILRSHTSQITLYAIWQFNNTNPDKPPDNKPEPPQELPQIAYCLYYDCNGGENPPAEQVQYSSAPNYTFEITAEQPKRPGYIFAGWSLTPNALQSDYQAGDKFQLNQNQPVQTLYAVWQHPLPPEQPVINLPGYDSSSDDLVETEQPEFPKARQIHKAYIQGYPDNSIKPLNYLTRAEASVMLYRLLPEPTPSNPVYNIANDVKPTAWYYKELNVLQQNGLIQGYADGSMQPDQNLTRAEFITILTRFNKLYLTNHDYTSDNGQNTSVKAFSDITGHWAEDYIKQAAVHGWVKGYPDNHFAPNQPITRAETVCALNKLLNRKADMNKLKINTGLNWSDNPENSWFYADLLEAGCQHAYSIEKDTEIWLDIYPTQP